MCVFPHSMSGPERHYLVHATVFGLTATPPSQFEFRGLFFALDRAVAAGHPSVADLTLTASLVEGMPIFLATLQPPVNWAFETRQVSAATRSEFLRSRQHRMAPNYTLFELT